ncbi:hypothetical protein [Acinetobacter variabilis]|uniref:Uncharacterized protein n=1 Tax=Acinetobacter variabilis TaxID=70346 RepID=N8VKE3_9GAMM|nr:hypothetical protein [Acinetobacter variabilis]ENV00387.1 hypothetical protein F969_00618 [Acinetobacter variabilis]
MFDSIFSYFSHRKACSNDDGYAYAKSQYEKSPTQETIDKLFIQGDGGYPGDNAEAREFDRGIHRYLGSNNLHSNLAGPYPPHID